MAGLRRAEDAVTLLARAKAQSGGAVEAFELISRSGVELAARNIPGVRDPLSEPYPWLVLIEIASAEAGHAEAALERLLASAFDEGLIADAALARSEAQSHALWRVREEQSAAQKPEGPSWKHDIAVPVSRVPRFLELAGAAVAELSPSARVVAFGHVGDGNIHYDVLTPLGGDGAAHAALREAAALRVHDIAHGLGGSISAEHGLGIMKVEAARRYKEPETVALMQRLRTAFDPQRIMNPRVLF
jgi:FAD/FMN-containing dehydrogenase